MHPETTKPVIVRSNSEASPSKTRSTLLDNRRSSVPGWSPAVLILVLLAACGKPHRQNVGNSIPDHDVSTAGHDAAAVVSNESTGLSSDCGGSSFTSSNAPAQPPAGERCPNVLSPSKPCCVGGKSCGTYVLVDDFPERCMLPGDLDAALDETCPEHVCVDPRARCTFPGCRMSSGACGIWVNRYSYRVGDYGVTYTVNLGCQVSPRKQ